MMDEIEILMLARDRLYEKAREDASTLVNAQRKYVHGYAHCISDSVKKIEWLDKKIEALSISDSAKKIEWLDKKIEALSEGKEEENV